MSNSPSTILETPRLFLRCLTLDDLDALAVLYRDPDVRRYFPEGTLTYEQTREELDWFIHEHYAKHGFGLWATIHKPTGAFIGRCGLLPWTIDGRAEVEVAYLLDKAYWGQGLATEAARAIVHYAFEHLGMTRLVCLPEPENAASCHVAEKAGFTLEREIVLDGTPARLYSIHE